MTNFKDSPSYQYHDLTKHSVASLYSDNHYLDWENQPNPFRHYQGAECVSLDPGEKDLSGNFFQNSPAQINRNISLKTLSSILFYSLSISAWKKYADSAWHLRVNPSAGNLHPEETHLIASNVEGLNAGIYHYNVYEHLLEMRCGKPFEESEWSSVGIDETTEKFCAFFVINVITWRQAWKYRSRAFRYCFHDAGHVIGSLQYVFEQMRLDFKVFMKINSGKLKKLLGLEDGDEFPLIVIGCGKNPGSSKSINSERVYRGKANKLSKSEISYPLIEEMRNHDICNNESNFYQQIDFEKNGLPTTIKPLETVSLEMGSPGEVKNFFTMVRNRRSAQAYDGKTEMELFDLTLILKKAFEKPKLDYNSMTSSLVNLFLFVHRVKGLERGLYLYNESECQLLLLQSGNMESTARDLSLSQEIASNSAVCFAMISNFPLAFTLLNEAGYRSVHFEAGRIGQALYLGSESLGYNSTGIGAFFDNDVNRFLQLKEGHEVVYHFAMGKAVPDKRLQTLDGYFHLNVSDQ